MDTDTSTVDETSTGLTETAEDSSQDVPADGTAQQTSDNTVGQVEDSFFDPNKVPEELKPAYKQMQADYTRKTQAIAEERKQAATLRQQAEAYKKYEQFVPIMEEMLSPNAKANIVPPELISLEQSLKAKNYSPEAIELAKETYMLARRATDQELQSRDKKAQDERFQTELNDKISKAEGIDPRLNDQSLVYQADDGTSFSFGEMVADLVKSTSDWWKDPSAATQRAIRQVDALIGKAKTDGKTELSNAVRSKSRQFAPVKSSPQSASQINKTASTMREAYEMSDIKLES